MAETPIDIDRIVREVLAELAKPGDTAAPATVSEKDRPAVRSSADGELAIADRVVTIGAIGNRLKAIRRLVVSPGAVLTPTVRDALRENNIALVRASDQPLNGASGVRLALVTAFTSLEPAALVDRLRKDGIDASVRASNCLIETTDALAAELRQPDRLGVVLTTQVAAALCLANRLAGVRAVTAENVAAVSKAAASVGANLLVLNPQGKSVFQLKQMIGEFHRLGRQPCPEALKKQLA